MKRINYKRLCNYMRAMNCSRINEQLKHSVKPLCLVLMRGFVENLIMSDEL